MLVDRLTERSALDSLLASARGGMGSALVLRGDPGIGELERSAGRAQARGGVAAAAAFLDRAVALTIDPARRADRALAAANAKLQVGAFDTALGLLATAETGPLDERQRAQAELLRAEVAAMSGRVMDAPPLLLKAARQLEPARHC
jgi:outer membrane PBP1 activator LpoA protein